MCCFWARGGVETEPGPRTRGRCRRLVLSASRSHPCPFLRPEPGRPPQSAPWGSRPGLGFGAGALHCAWMATEARAGVWVFYHGKGREFEPYSLWPPLSGAHGPSVGVCLPRERAWLGQPPHPLAPQTIPWAQHSPGAVDPHPQVLVGGGAACRVAWELGGDLGFWLPKV